MNYQYGVFATVSGKCRKLPIKTNSIEETVDAVQEFIEMPGDFSINVEWGRSRYFENDHYRLAIMRLLHSYDKTIGMILRLREFEINFVVNQEYYDENVELTEIPFESSIFHYHRGL